MTESGPAKDQNGQGAEASTGPVIAAFLIGSVLLFVAVQTTLSLPPDEYGQALWMLLAFGIAGALVAANSLTRRAPLPGLLDRLLRRVAEFLTLSPAQVVLLAYAPLLSYAGKLAAGDSLIMHIPWLAVAMWVTAVAFVVAGVWPKEPDFSLPDLPRWEYLLILGMVALALALRVLMLDSIPWVLTGDEGSAGLSAAEFASGVRNNIFNTAWYSWPSFYFLLPGATVRLFGNTELAVRLPSAVAGAITLLALYPFARAAFGRKVALASVAYLAAFHFHIHFSRLGLNNIWDGLFFALITAILWKAWTSGRYTLFALAGLILGFSMYFYASARVLVFLLPVWLFVAWLRDREGFRARRGGLVLLVVAAVVVVLPLGVFYVRNPDELLAPYRRFSILGGWLENEAARTGLPTWRILLSQVGDASLAYTGLNLRYWYQIDFPMLLPLPAALFLLGLVFVVLQPTQLPNLWILLWLGSGVAGGALTESTPAAQRYVFTAPIVAMLVAIGLVRTWEAMSDLWPRARLWVAGGAIVLLAAAVVIDLQYYFFQYTPSRRFADTNTLVAQRVADFLEDQPPDYPVYFLGPPRMSFSSHGSLPYLAPEHQGIDVVGPISALAQEGLQLPAIFIVLPEREEELEWLRSEFPDGRTYTETGPDDKMIFLAYVVDRQPGARLPRTSGARYADLDVDAWLRSQTERLGGRGSCSARTGPSRCPRLGPLRARSWSARTRDIRPGPGQGPPAQGPPGRPKGDNGR